MLFLLNKPTFLLKATFIMSQTLWRFLNLTPDPYFLSSNVPKNTSRLSYLKILSDFSEHFRNGCGGVGSILDERLRQENALFPSEKAEFFCCVFKYYATF